MGMDYDTLLFLKNERVRGVSFERTLTLGHQNIYMPISRYQKAIAMLGNRGYLKSDIYSDDLFYTLGSQILDIMDISDYEQANIIHDLGSPIPEKLHEKYSCVFDGGTLEHIFDIPTAITNCMGMVREGGSLILANPANNLAGHGFYQFSPELFASVFTAKNGFKLERMFLLHNGRWYNAENPLNVGRIDFNTKYEATLFVSAKKIRAGAVSLELQQSDYKAAWNNSGKSSIRFSIKKRIREIIEQIPYLEKYIEKLKKKRRYLKFSLGNNKHFTRVHLE
jgi:hypothetical protein